MMQLPITRPCSYGLFVVSYEGMSVFPGKEKLILNYVTSLNAMDTNQMSITMSEWNAPWLLFTRKNFHNKPRLGAAPKMFLSAAPINVYL